MLSKSVPVTFILALAATLSGSAHAQAQPSATPNFTGTYRCEAQPSECWPGQTITVTQSGSNLELKNDQGTFASAQLTSDITLSSGPTWNALGVVLPDHSIQWSNGTHWRKQ